MRKELKVMSVDLSFKNEKAECLLTNILLMNGIY